MVSELDTGDVLARRKSLEGEWTRGGMPTMTLAPKGVDWEVPHRLKKETSVHWASKGVDCEISHRLGRRMKHSFMRVWKPISSIRIKEARKGNEDTRAPKGVESLEGGGLEVVCQQ